jgi:hypothetical protein
MTAIRASSLPADIRRRFGLWRCKRGHHAPLEWFSQKKRPMVNLGGAQEIAWVGFIASFAKWNGWCPRCGTPVAWSDSKPRPGEDFR